MLSICFPQPKITLLPRLFINLCLTAGLLMRMCWMTKLGHDQFYYTDGSSSDGKLMMIRGGSYRDPPTVADRDLDALIGDELTGPGEGGPGTTQELPTGSRQTFLGWWGYNNRDQALSSGEAAAAPCNRDPVLSVADVEDVTMDESPPVFQANTPGAPSCAAAITSDQVSFTLVTQSSMDRLWMMEHQCRRWGREHPISIAVATKVSKRVLYKALAKLGCDRESLTITTYGDFDDHKSYPVNKLRNLALSGVQTTHALVIDMDFLVAENVYEILSLHKAPLAADHSTAYVIPAFEFRSLCGSGNMDACKKLHEALVPHTKPDLLDLYLSPSEEATVAPFDSKSNVAGHGSTRYSEWISQSDDQLLPIECVTSPRYEPYLVVRYCQDLPPFQEAYNGYGQNKLTWMQQLVRTGYSFWQVPTFCIHFPHPQSEAKKSWERQRADALLLSSMAAGAGSATDSTVDQSEAVVIDPAVAYASLRVNQISAQFQSWMTDNVPDRSVVLQC